MLVTLVGDLSKSLSEPGYWMLSTTPLIMSWSELKLWSRMLLCTLMPPPSGSTTVKTMMSNSVRRKLSRMLPLPLLMLQVQPPLLLLLNPKREADTYKLLLRESKLVESSIFMLLSNSMLEECWLASPRDQDNLAALTGTF